MRLRQAPGPARFYGKPCGLVTRIGAALLLALCLPAGVGQAEGEAGSEEPAWIPSLDVGFDTFAYSAKVETTNLVPDSAAAAGSGSGDALQLRLQFGGQLEGPKLEWLPGRPRLFAQGGVGLPSFSSDNLFATGPLQQPPEDDIAEKYLVVRRGDFDTDTQPANPKPAGNDVPDCYERNPKTCATLDFSDIRGIGSQVGVELGDVSWYAGLGIGFDVPIGESLLLQVKPSVAYQGEPVKLSGGLATVTVDDNVPVSFTCRPGKTCAFGTEFTTQEFTVWRGPSNASITDHSLGLGLELDLALFRSSSPIRASLFVDTRFLWLLSDPVTTFSSPTGTKTIQPTPATQVTTPTDFPVASYRVDREPFDIRGGAGVRFSWVGFGR